MSKLILTLIFVGSAFLNASQFCRSGEDRETLLNKSNEIQKELEGLLKEFENQEISNDKFNNEFKPKERELNTINNRLKCLNHESRLSKKPSGIVFKRAYEYAKKTNNSKMKKHIQDEIKKRQKSLKFLEKKGIFEFSVAEEKGKIWVQYFTFVNHGVQKKVESFKKPKKKHIQLGYNFSSFDKKALAYEIEKQLWNKNAKPYEKYKKENKLKVKVVDPKHNFEQETCPSFSRIVQVNEIRQSLADTDCYLKDGEYTLEIRGKFDDEYTFKNGFDEMKITVPSQNRITVTKREKQKKSSWFGGDDEEIPEREQTTVLDRNSAVNNKNPADVDNQYAHKAQTSEQLYNCVKTIGSTKNILGENLSYDNCVGIGLNSECECEKAE
jgi:hypothetical protein